MSLDPRNIEASEGLARLFFKRKEFNHARELYEYIIKLGGQRAEHFIELAEAWLAQDQLKQALEVLKKALRIHPRSPKLVDKLVNIAILLKDSGLAKDFLSRLREINPENNKIGEYRKVIRAL